MRKTQPTLVKNCDVEISHKLRLATSRPRAAAAPPLPCPGPAKIEFCTSAPNG